VDFTVDVTLAALDEPDAVDSTVDVTFAVLDEPHADARATWAVIHHDQRIGYISEATYARRRYRVDSAGLAVPMPPGQFPSRETAAEAIVAARATAPMLRTGASGLRRLEEAVLSAERRWLTEPPPGERDQEAARLGISPVQYLQIVRWLREDSRAYACDPATVNRLRARHVAAMTRTARLRRDASLAEAS
jgi:hypothetical protein